MTPDSRALLRWALLLLTPVGVFAALVGRVPVPLTALIGVCIGALLAVAATRRPQLAVAVAIAVVAVVPYYDGRLVTRAVGITPMGMCCLVLLPAAWRSRSQVRLRPLDIAVGALVLLRALALLLNFSGGLGGVITLGSQVALPYLVFRVLLAGRDQLTALAGTVVTVAVGLSVIGVLERNGLVNPFFTLLPPEYQAAQWARPETRNHGVRSEASFGHPIAFGMFLAVALVLAVALALVVRQLWASTLLLLGAGVIVLALVDTQARGPLLAAALGVGAWLLIVSGRVSVLRLAAVVGLLVVVVSATPALVVIQRLVDDTQASDTRTGASTAYRLEILAVATDPEQFSLLGKQNDDGGVTDAVFQRTGLVSIDSEFAFRYLTDGFLTLAAFTAVVVIVLRLSVRPGLTPLERAWAVGMGATTLNLLTVALLTQQAELYWAWLGLLAGVVQRSRAVADREDAPRREVLV